MTGGALVTGGAGFIGSTLVDRLLASGQSVDVVDDLSTGSIANLADARADRANDFRFHHHDIADPSVVDLIAHRAPAVVYHLAARPDLGSHTARPDLDARVDVLGALHVLEGARAAGSAKVVFTSSGAGLYARVPPSKLPVRESAAQEPTSPHTLAKRVVMEYLGLYRELYELEFTALVLAAVYGPRQGADGDAGTVLALAGELLAGGHGTLPGDGGQTRDFVFVDDVVDALVRAAARGSGLACNIGSGTETSLLDLHRSMAVALGRDAHAMLGGEPLDGPDRFALDPGRAAIHLGWKPFTPLDTGLRELLAWRRGAGA
jgi:UDP-glucose 4-epimerase